MTDARIHTLDPPSSPSAGNDQPKVFTRAIVTPAGLPWEQTRVANLDARHGAPLPLSELAHRVKRLAGWAPGRPGRFAVFYVRAKELRGPLETIVEVEGQPVAVAFGVAGANTKRLQQVGLLLLMLLCAGAVLGTGLGLAGKSRREAGVRLDMAERLSRSKLAAAQAYRRQVDDDKVLKAGVAHGKPVGDVLDDLSWVATSKAPDVRILAVHWSGGVMALEVHGDTPPFGSVDRRLERSDRPLRPGVWVWGVDVPASKPAQTVTPRHTP